MPGLMKKYLLRFGIPTILAVMFAGTLYILNSFELRTKAMATLVLSDEGGMKVYVPRKESVGLQAGDTVGIDQTMAGCLVVVIDSVREETENSVLYVHLSDSDGRSLRNRLDGNSLSGGYIYARSVKLRDLFFKRMVK